MHFTFSFYLLKLAITPTLDIHGFAIGVQDSAKKIFKKFLMYICTYFPEFVSHYKGLSSITSHLQGIEFHYIPLQQIEFPFALHLH